MLAINNKQKIFLAINPIDFRCGIDGIANVCKRQFLLDPQSGHLFVFRNKAATSVKILGFDNQGYWLLQKRLSQGSFRHWPTSQYSVVYLSTAQCHVLLDNGNPGTVATAPPWKHHTAH
jgi:transposase